MVKTLFFSIAMGFFLICSALGYGNAGHQAVGNIAAYYLTGTRAEAEVKTLLAPNEDLARAATWADRAKLNEKYLDNEMKDFVGHNPTHQSFHYCDIPFQEKAYRNGLFGTNDRDIVHILCICIAVLKNPVDDLANPLKINKRVALRLITHLVGDLHQPLHVGCSYVDKKDQFVNPVAGGKGQPDAGANCFRLNARTSLHGYWDTQTVKLARDLARGEDFPAYLMTHFPSQPTWKVAGFTDTWPEQWATDTLALSKECFQGITLGPRFIVPKEDHGDESFEWKITLQPGYDEKARKIVEVQLSKAGYRLAALLRAIWPEK